MQAELGQENLLRMVRWVRWHCPPDTRFENKILEVWGRARYLSVTEAPYNTVCYEWMGKKHICFFQTAETGKRTPNSDIRYQYSECQISINGECETPILTPELLFFSRTPPSKFCIRPWNVLFPENTRQICCLNVVRPRRRRVNIETIVSSMSRVCWDCDELFHFVIK